MTTISAKKKLLIIEDDADVRLGYRVLFHAHNYLTSFANDGVSAMKAALQHSPDMIILDLGLPAGDGFVVLDRLKSNMNLTMIPVVVVSGRNLHGNRERALLAGAVDFVQKPWEDRDLLSLIARTLGTEAPAVAAPQARVATTIGT